MLCCDIATGKPLEEYRGIQRNLIRLSHIVFHRDSECGHAAATVGTISEIAMIAYKSGTLKRYIARGEVLIFYEVNKSCAASCLEVRCHHAAKSIEHRQMRAYLILLFQSS